MQHFKTMFMSPRTDFPAGLVVFLVALPLCLGIALASGVPLMSGLIAGAMGGLIVPLLSRSPLSVAGPAAGMTAVVLAGIQELGSLELFFASVMVAGLIQIVFGLLRADGLTGLVPSAVIRGMLAAIGIILILKQAPHMVGHDEFDFGVEETGLTFYKHLSVIFDAINFGALLIGTCSILLLVFWNRTPFARFPIFPPALAVVLFGTITNLILGSMGSSLALDATHLVALPVVDGIQGLLNSVPRPDASMLFNSNVVTVAFTVATVASIETLLSLEAVDKIDPLQRRSPGGRELVAQGCANMASGFLGGLPVTSVIVRSSANVASGGKERLSALFHGVLLILAILFLSTWLNYIPLACLAAILLQTGFKLASPSLMRQMWRKGTDQFLPFAITIIAVLSLDLLRGVAAGIVLGIAFALYLNNRNIFRIFKRDGDTVLRFQKDATFLSKPALRRAFEDFSPGDKVMLENGGVFMDQDVSEAIHDLVQQAKENGVTVDLAGMELSESRITSQPLPTLPVTDLAKKMGQSFRRTRKKA